MNCLNVICELNIKKIIFSSENDEFEIHKTSDYHTDHVSNGNRYLQTLMGETPTPPKCPKPTPKCPKPQPKCAKPPKQRPKSI